MYSLKTCAIGIGMSKHLYALSIKPFWEFLPGQNRVYFFHCISIWKPYLFLKSRQSYFWLGWTVWNHLNISTYRFLCIPIAVVVVRSLPSETSVCMPCFQLCHKPTGFLVFIKHGIHDTRLHIFFSSQGHPEYGEDKLFTSVDTVL